MAPFLLGFLFLLNFFFDQFNYDFSFLLSTEGSPTFFLALMLLTALTVVGTELLKRHWLSATFVFLFFMDFQKFRTPWRLWRLWPCKRHSGNIALMSELLILNTPFFFIEDKSPQNRTNLSSIFLPKAVRLSSILKSLSSIFDYHGTTTKYFSIQRWNRQ